MTADRISRNLTGLLLVGGLAAIATAWGFQLIGGYVPCKLCLEQRIPYYLSGGTSFFEPNRGCDHLQVCMGSSPPT